MKKIFFLLLLVSNTIFSQQIETFSYPKNSHLFKTWELKINPVIHFFPANQEDLHLKKGKPIKNISCYYNDKNAKTYYIEFTPDGKIAMTDDFYRNEKFIFKYSKDIITKRHYEYRNDKSERLSSIDSIIYDNNHNIIRKSFTKYDINERFYENQIEDYEYQDKDKLVKKYQYYITKNMPYVAGQLFIYEYDKNSITEKNYYFENINHSAKELKKDSLKINSSSNKKIYHLNLKKQITRLDQYSSDIIAKSISLKFDGFNRINSITSTTFETPDTTTFKFDIRSNIIEISYDEMIEFFKYDKNNNVISHIEKFKIKTYEIPDNINFNYEYDNNNNWTSIVIFKNGTFDTKMTRIINYY